MNTPWHMGPLASYDCETSGLNIDADRIVTAALVRPCGETLRWLSDADGIEIPEAASSIHKVTTERARHDGRPAKAVVEEIADAISVELSAGKAALVVMNAPYDLSLLDRECARHNVPTVAERVGSVSPVIDPLVLDRAADKYRKGRRSLEALAAHYGIPLTDAHSADADAHAALGVALRIAERYPELQVPATQVHAWQIAWHQRWAEGYQQYRRKTDARAVVRGDWPLIGTRQEEEVR